VPLALDGAGLSLLHVLSRLALPELLVELVIDSAGKVRSAESAAPAFDASLKSEVGRWKFVPAFDGGHGVASHVYMLVSQKR